MTTFDTTTALNGLRTWHLSDLEPDETVHRNVQIRESQLSPLGAHVTHVLIRGDRGAKIAGTVHPDEHETIYVVSGLVVADIGGRCYEGQPGTYFDIPKGVVHGYTPLCGYVVELLAIYVPA
jgi:quercetin dioxygenase-like cupin family protein